VPSTQQGLEIRRTATRKGIKDEIAWFGVPLDQPTRQLRKELGWILVQTVSENCLIIADEEEPVPRLHRQVGVDRSIDPDDLLAELVLDHLHIVTLSARAGQRRQLGRYLGPTSFSAASFLLDAFVNLID
jgi:hypothetical protein